MKTKIFNDGDDFVLRIPKTLAENIDLYDGCQVEVNLSGDEIHIRLSSPQHYTLDELLAGITSQNIHKEIKL